MNYCEQKTLDGKLFCQLVIGAANELKNNVKTVNDLNVFPIPDGDTGDNMYRTISGGATKLQSATSDEVGVCAKILADGMLLNARGNSGVILSQLFAGMAKGFEDVKTATLTDIAKAMQAGVERGYKAVVTPVEGTILTVARESVQYAVSQIDEQSTLGSFMKDVLKEMPASLERTPDLLDVLKEAGVVDSGGAGLLYIAHGANAVLEGKSVEGELTAATTAAHDVDLSKFNEDSVMEFGYCTEFLLQLQKIKVDVEKFDENVVIDYLNTIGDSIVAFKTGTVIKVHVHTMQPYKALEFCQQFGEFLTIKIENMTLQHNEHVAKQKEDNLIPTVKRARRKFGLCTVAVGEGLTEVFRELGADVVIDGGQGKNPSIADFIEAFNEIDADNIFVLPNNSNIIMAARQAADVYENGNVYVIPSKNFGHAYAALSMLDYSSDNAEVIAANLENDMHGVTTGMISRSIRDANLNGVEIRESDYVGFTDKTMLVSNADKTAAFFALCDKLHAEEMDFFTVVYGKDATAEERAAAHAGVAEKYPNVEFYEIDGGQDVYDFILILE